MLYLYIFLALTMLAFVYMSFEAGWLKVDRVYFNKNKKALKVLQLSDIHINRLRVDPVKVKNVIANEKPDIILLTGDYIEHAYQAEKFFKFLDLILPKNGTNVFFCLGNHDYEAFLRDQQGQENFLKRMQDAGCTPLHNASVCFEKNGKKYNIIGIADMRYRKHNVDEALKSLCSDAVANIAFSHNPDVSLEIPKGKVDHLVCGHFHGGQIWAPFNIEFALLRREKLCKMGITRGLNKVNSINLYINRGLGNVVFPLRFFSRPEITVFYI